MDATTEDRWAQPQAIDNVFLAFPACVIGTMIPAWEDVPKEFRDATNPWARSASTWFAYSPHVTFSADPKAGVDMRVAARHLLACLRSYEPKHEHKIAAVAYLMSRWFDRLHVARSDPDPSPRSL